MRMVVGIALSLACASPVVLPVVSPALAQTRRALICSEEVSVRLSEPAKPDAPRTEEIDRRSFSLTSGGDTLNLISAGKSEFYECQKVTPRLNEGRPRNTMKCQNGIYFLTLDFSQLKFAKSQMNPESMSDVSISYGSCRFP
ncbi:hypothetical protein [Methylobacterium oxalidis]|uniref:hypothetical protein n=1 Tax=Methylobacterium oxalidis TaxID=944322 RepID=UPI0033160412